MADRYISNVIHEWGMSKTIEVILLAFAGASIFSIAGVHLIKNEPMLIVKENENEN